MSAVLGRHDDFAGGAVSNNDKFLENGEGRNALGRGRGMRRVGKGQKQIRDGHWNLLEWLHCW
jgi:hypothetical protein